VAASVLHCTPPYTIAGHLEKPVGVTSASCYMLTKNPTFRWSCGKKLYCWSAFQKSEGELGESWRQTQKINRDGPFIYGAIINVYNNLHPQ
jgi:hypothetical protein